MRRGSTPTFIFSLPLDTSCLKEIEIFFLQKGQLILTVDRQALSMDGKEVSFMMSEQESMAFASSLPAEIQIRLVTTDGTVWISEIRSFSVRKKYPEDAL